MFGFTKVWAMLSTASSVPGSPLELFFFVFFLFFQWFYKHFIENVWFYQGLGNKLLTNCASRTPVQGHKVPPQTSSVPGSPLELFFFVFFLFFQWFYKHFIENVWFYQGLGNKLLTNCASRTPVQGHKVPPQTSTQEVPFSFCK